MWPLQDTQQCSGRCSSHMTHVGVGYINLDRQLSARFHDIITIHLHGPGRSVHPSSPTYTELTAGFG